MLIMPDTILGAGHIAGKKNIIRAFTLALCRKDSVEFKAKLLRPCLESKAKEYVFCPLQGLSSNRRNS